MSAHRRLLTLILVLAGLLCGPLLAAPRGVPGAIFSDGFEGNFRIVPIDLLGAVAERNFGHQIRVLPPASTVVLYAIDSGPTGLSIDSTGVLSWTPGLADGGQNTVTVRAEDDQGAVDTETFVIEVLLPNSPPLIDTIGERIVAANQTLSLIVPASDPDVGDVLSYTLDAGPGGMQLNPLSGLLTWTPTVADLGPHPVTVRVTDSRAFFDLESFQVQVIDANQPPVLNPVADQGAFLNQSFSLQLLATDPDLDPLQYSLTQAPTGMSINAASGLISWIPTSLTQGSESVSVAVIDGRGGSDSASFTILIDNNLPPIAVDDAYTVERGDTLNVPALGVLINDADPNLSPLSAVLVDDAGAGTLALAGDGGFSYTPDQNLSPFGFVEKYRVQSPNGGRIGMPRLGDVDGDGAPDIFVRYSNGAAGANRGLLVRASDGSQIYQTPAYDRSVEGSQGFLLADIDLDGRMEMVAVGTEGGRTTTQDGRKLIAFEHDGSFKWISEAIPQDGIYLDAIIDQRGNPGGEIAVADLDGDGTPELIHGHAQTDAIGVTVFDNNGRILFTRYARGVGFIRSGIELTVEVVDLDLDGDLEILVSGAAFSHRGEVLWTVPGDLSAPRSTPIAANLDDDPYPELVRATDTNDTAVYEHDGSLKWQVVTTTEEDLPLVIADVDDDGRADILSAAGRGSSPGFLEVYNGADGSLKWRYPTVEDPTFDPRYYGPVVMDFDGDGKVEVAIIDQDIRAHVLNGVDGTLIGIFDLDNASGVRAMPIMADVDGDGASEMIIHGESRFGVGTSDIVRVYEGPNDDWPAARPIWNQWNYHVTNINEDGTVPAQEQPHWLLPGLNANRVNALLPEERTPDVDQFTYRASDGALQSNLATVRIEVLPPNSAPQILSTPRTLASPDFEYRYAVLAVDPDVGESLSFQLVQAPAGMSVNALGIITWTPTAGDLGTHPIILQVTDSLGYSDTQLFDLLVRTGTTVPDVIGLTEAAAVNAVAAADLGANPIVQVFDAVVPVGQVRAQLPSAGSAAAAGDSVRLEVSQGPAPVTVPRVVGLDLLNAGLRLMDGNLMLGALNYVNRDDLPLGTVFQQSPAPGSSAAPGSNVALSVSGGPRIDIALDNPVLIGGQSSPLNVVVYSNEGLPLNPQPSITLSILEAVPGASSGPLPTVNSSSVQSSPSTQGEYLLRVDLPDTMESYSTRVVVMESIADAPEGSIYADFGAQLEQAERLISELEAAVLANNVPAIQMIDAQLQTLRTGISVDRIRGLTPLAPEGGMPPDRDTAISMGFAAGADDQAYLQANAELAQSLQQMAVLVANPLTPNVELFNLNQRLLAQGAALSGLEPGVPGVLAAIGPTVELIGHQIPALLVTDLDALHQSLLANGLLGPQAPLQMHKAVRFTLAGVLSATRIRTRIIKNVYRPILGDVIRAAVILVAQNGLVSYANAGNLAGIITAASLSIHVAKIPNSVAEGVGFEAYAPANSTILIGPDAIEQAQSILSAGLSTAQDLKDINKIQANLKSAADIGNNTVGLVKGAITSPGSLRRGCFLDPTPGCQQLVFPDGFDSAYVNDGPLALPAPVLIVTFGLASGNIGVFVGIFLPTEPEN
ncbi:MAG: putative Ig domain-containing protein [Lysobacterales bacterium]